MGGENLKRRRGDETRRRKERREQVEKRWMEGIAAEVSLSVLPGLDAAHWPVKTEHTCLYYSCEDLH